MGFSRSHNDELNAFERGRAGADTPTSIQDFDASLSMAIQDADTPNPIWALIDVTPLCQNV